MTRWVAYLGLTALVLLSFLSLARLSQSTVREDGPSAGAPDPAPAPAPAPDPIPAHEDESATPVSPPGDDGPVGDGVATSGPGEPVDSPFPDRSPADRTLDAGDAEFGPAALLANVALTQGLVGAVLAGGVVYFEIPFSALGLTGDPRVGGLPALGLGLAFGVALWVGNEAAASAADAVGAAYDERVRELLAPDSPGGWAVLLGLVLPTIAVVEELLFRASLVGVAHVGLGISAWLLAVLSSAAFALGHGAQGRVGIVVTGLLGFVLAAGFVLTGSLLVVVVAHYVVNALEFLVHEWLDVDRLPS